MRLEIASPAAIRRPLLTVSTLVASIALCLSAAGQESADASGAKCGMPKLFAIPPKDQIAGHEEEIRAAAKAYFAGIAAYSACVQAEIIAAGGDRAPGPIKQVLILRNNAAVDEADFMMKRFTDTFGTGTAAPVASAAPAPVPAAR
jgi:hypothetical protein